MIPPSHLSEVDTIYLPGNVDWVTVVYYVPIGK